MSGGGPLLALFALALAACSTEQTVIEPDPSWNRMLAQPRSDPYEPSTFFRDGRAMRTPPAGTVDRARIVGQPLLTRGTAPDGTYATTIPLPVTPALLALGRERFETVCANCHGVLGDGVSPVAENMQLRRPPSLHEDRIRAYPPGRIFQVITQGYGLMASHAAYLSVPERWAVVAYVRALELSQHAEVSALPPALRAELSREAP